MNTNTLELRRIQIELKSPFPAEVHEIRDLPGGGKRWVFLRWQTVRERLDEVYPEWVIDHSEIQYLGNDAICRCGITIMGVRKEAIASVPITLLSKNGNDMARGSAADRLAAEALKNAAEQWGVGRYLDDQLFTITYLWENRNKLDERMVGEVRKLCEQYKLRVKEGQAPPPTKQTLPSPQKTRYEAELSKGLNIPAIGTPKITEAQAGRLWAIAKGELHLTQDDVKDVLLGFGIETTRDISVDKYDQVIEALKAFNCSGSKFSASVKQ